MLSKVDIALLLLSPAQRRELAQKARQCCRHALGCTCEQCQEVSAYLS